jgi:HEAT repeat protein
VAAVDALLAKLDDRENYRAIMQALQASNDERAFPALIARLEDADAPIRARAVYDVGTAEIPTRVELVAKRLADESPEVRIAAVDVLARLGAADVLPQLEPLAADAHTQVAAHAARAIKRLRAKPD